MEAHRLGYDEGIGLAADGTLSEGAGENLFMVKNGVLFTPHQAAAILSGITRDSVIRLAHAMGLEVREQALTREALYTADELFFTGTAAEITPIASVDDLDGGQRHAAAPSPKRIQDSVFRPVQRRNRRPFRLAGADYGAGR